MENNITVTIPIELYNELLSYKINLDEAFKTKSIAIVECKFLLRGSGYFYKIITKDECVENLTKTNNDLSEKCNKFGEELRQRDSKKYHSMSYPNQVNESIGIKGFWNRLRWFLSL